MGAIDARRLTRENALGDWERAVGAYRRSRAAAKSLEAELAAATAEPPRDVEARFDALVDRWSAAMETLLLLEAPSVAAVAIKARVVADDGVSDLVIAPFVARAIAADLERLAA
jgi:hypothetical protein